MFDLLKPTRKVTVVDEHVSTVMKEHEEEDEDMEVDDRDREERLESQKKAERVLDNFHLQEVARGDHLGQYNVAREADLQRSGGRSGDA